MNTQLIEFDKLKAQITMFVAPTKDVVVTDSGTDIIAQGVLKTLSDFEKQIEAKRVEMKRPLLEETRRIDTYAGEISEPLEKAKAEIKEKRAAWAVQEKARLAEEQRKIEAERVAQEKAAQAARDAAEAEARKKRLEDEAALKRKQAEEKKAFEAEQKKKAEALALFGVGDEDLKAEKAAAQKAMKEKAEADKAALAQKAEQDRLEAQAKFEREQADQAAALKARERTVLASRPKNTREVPEWKIVDHSKVPAKYWVINDALLGSEIRGGLRDVPGVEIKMVTQIISGR